MDSLFQTPILSLWVIQTDSMSLPQLLLKGCLHLLPGVIETVSLTLPQVLLQGCLHLFPWVIQTVSLFQVLVQGFLHDTCTAHKLHPHAVAFDKQHPYLPVGLRIYFSKLPGLIASTQPSALLLRFGFGFGPALLV